MDKIEILVEFLNFMEIIEEVIKKLPPWAFEKFLFNDLVVLSWNFEGIIFIPKLIYSTKSYN